MSAATPLSELPIDRVLDRLDGVKKRSSGGFMALCPAHDDRNPSLSIDENEIGDVLLNCFANCDKTDIVEAMGLRLSDLFATPEPPRPRPMSRQQRQIVDTTDFVNEDGEIVFQEVRYEPKKFSQRRPDGKGGWIYNLEGITPILWNLPALRAEPERAVILVEGCKDAKRLASMRLLATTNPMGAGKWRSEYSQVLRGRKVYIIYDNDVAGRKHGYEVGRSLLAHECEVHIGKMPRAREKGDVSDWLDQDPRNTKEILEKVLRRFDVMVPLDEEYVDPWEDLYDAPDDEPFESEPVEQTTPPPTFPIEILPAEIRTYTTAAATSVGVPVEMVAIPLMGFVGGLIGDRLRIQLKRGFVQFGGLYIAIVAPPGSAKSPALNAAKKPFDILQAKAHKEYEVAKGVWEEDVERWQNMPKEDRGAKPIRPSLRHIYSTDLTIEALVGILANAPGITIVRDELLGWITSLDQYRGGKGSDRQQYLSVWSSSTIKYDRRSGESVFRETPVVSIMGGIQPDHLSDLHDKSGKRDGFIERVLMYLPDVRLSSWTDDDIDPALLDPVRDLLGDLDRRLSPVDRNADADTQLTMLLHPEARDLWKDWYDQNVGIVGQSEGLRAGFGSKLAPHVARFALILNALWNPDNPNVMVSPEILGYAITLGEYSRQHFDRVLPLIGDQSTDRVETVANRILRILRIEGKNSDGGWVGRRVILQGLRNVKTVDVTTSLEHLAESRQVETRQQATSTKPREEWRLSNNSNNHTKEHIDGHSFR